MHLYSMVSLNIYFIHISDELKTIEMKWECGDCLRRELIMNNLDCLTNINCNTERIDFSLVSRIASLLWPQRRVHISRSILCEFCFVQYLWFENSRLIFTDSWIVLCIVTLDHNSMVARDSIDSSAKRAGFQCTSTVYDWRHFNSSSTNDSVTPCIRVWTIGESACLVWPVTFTCPMRDIRRLNFAPIGIAVWVGEASWSGSFFIPDREIWEEHWTYPVAGWFVLRWMKIKANWEKTKRNKYFFSKLIFSTDDCLVNRVLSLPNNSSAYYNQVPNSICLDNTAG